MLGSLKTRMLLVIIVIFLVGMGLQGSNGSKNILEPAIQYVLKDYGFNNSISQFIENMKSAAHESIPADSSSVLQIPCEFTAVVRNYGWYYNEEQGKQDFFPGVYLKVESNTAVKPIIAGEVQEIGRNEDGRMILIKHDEAFFSIYGGLKEVLAEENSWVDSSSVLGKSGDTLYLEIRNADGPLNPYNLINEHI